MIQQIYIKNFKAFEKETIPIYEHNILIGENDSGKSTILQALDIFFNQDKIDKNFVRDISSPVEIGILVNKVFYKKIFSTSTYKLTDTSENIDDIEYLRYIYIPVMAYDPKQLISQLAVAKAISNTDEELLAKIKEISSNSIDEIINGIDKDLLIINGESTKITGLEKFKYDGALKFDVTSNGIPVEARGTGFQKNLMYALLVGSNYDNVILGIDEIENSFSINNCSTMISEIQRRIGQTLISTHSIKVLEVKNSANVIPLFSSDNKTLSVLLKSLDNTDEKKYLLVEGKFDLPWYKRVISLLKEENKYIILPGGGSDNADILKKELESFGKECIIIKDKDTNDENTIEKDCIELYTPLDAINEILDLKLTSVPSTKEDFFTQTVIEEKRNSESVKRILADNVDKFLTKNNPLVKEVSMLIARNNEYSKI